MSTAELNTLLRAVASLHPPGDIDPQLVEALAGLIAGGQRDEWRRAALARRPMAAPPVDSSVVETPPPAQAQRNTAPSQPYGRPRRSSADGRPRIPQDRVEAIESELRLLESSADLRPTQRLRPTASASRRSEPETPAAARPVETLLAAVRVRAVLREMASTPAPSAQLDIGAAVNRVARCIPNRAVPHRMLSRLPHAMFWLFDAGPSMLPYAQDKQQLARSATRLLGGDRVRIGDFIASPLKGVRARGQVRWTPLRWPARHSALVVVSDLGASASEESGPSVHEDWQQLLELAAQREVSTVLLNPYERARWPALAARFDLALTWDVDSGVQALRRTRRAGGRH